MTRAPFRAMMAERRAYARGTPDHTYRTRAARKMLWTMRGVPVDRWGE
jgi:hypothetical protein